MECTSNISSMVVTRDVSKLSGWLNAFANCRVMRRAYEAGGMMAGKARGRGAVQRCKQRAGEGLDG